MIKQNVLPKKLKQLYFGKNFNCALEENTLPSLLEELVLGECYNKSIGKNILPLNLKILKFGKNFNKQIEPDAYPPKLEQLIFGDDYNLSINYLPENLTLLGFGKYYDKPILMEIYPKDLKIIQLYGSEYNKYIFVNLPDSFEQIIFTNLEAHVTNLPLSINVIQLINYNDDTANYLKYSHGVTIIDSHYRILNKIL